MTKTKNLKDYVKNKRKYIKIDDGETIQAVYQGFDIIPSKFNADEESVRYKLEVEDEVKPWDTSSAVVADEFAKLEPGQKVSITRVGSGTKTKYEIKNLA